MARRTIEEIDLDNCRAVVYTFGPAGRKGSKKCVACEWYFIPVATMYPFHDVDALDTKGLVYLIGEQWYAETGCCPNCEPGNSTVKYGWRRNLGYRSQFGGWRKGYGNAYEWFPIQCRYDRQSEASGRYRRQMPVHASGQSSQMRTQLLKAGMRIAKKLGCTPTKAGFGDGGVYLRTVKSVFGSLENFVIELGLEPRHSGSQGSQFTQQYSDRELRRLLREMFQRKGHALSKLEWNKEVSRPCVGVIINRLGDGSWCEAWRSVGIEPNSQGFPKGAMEKGRAKSLLARGFNPDECGKPAYEILNDPDSDYNRMRREVERKVEEHYLPEALEARERWEQGKFKKGDEIHDPSTDPRTEA